MRAQFDHLVVAIRSLSEGIAELEQLTGVGAVRGGRHPGRGTENALVSLGDGKYLEIIAPEPGAQLSASDAAMRALDRLHIITWAVSVSDAVAAASALKAVGFETTPAQPGSRVTPSGERLEWTTLGFADRRLAVAPFLIAWSAATKHPSATAPPGCDLVQVTVTDPASDRIEAALDAIGVSGITHANGAPRIDATLRCGSKTATLTTPPTR